MSVESKAILLGLLNVALMTAGIALQKANGVRGGSALVSPLLVAAFLCFAPTFFVTNIAFAIGARVSVYITVGALGYLANAVVAWAFFDERISAQQVAGFTLICVGVALVAFARAEAT